MHEQIITGNMQVLKNQLPGELSSAPIFVSMWDWDSQPRHSNQSSHNPPFAQSYQESSHNDSSKSARVTPVSRSYSNASQRSHRRCYSSSAAMGMHMPEPTFYGPKFGHPTFIQSPLSSPHRDSKGDPLLDAVIRPTPEFRLSSPSPQRDVKHHRRTSSYSCGFHHSSA